MLPSVPLKHIYGAPARLKSVRSCGRRKVKFSDLSGSTVHFCKVDRPSCPVYQHARSLLKPQPEPGTTEWRRPILHLLSSSFSQLLRAVIANEPFRGARFHFRGLCGGLRSLNSLFFSFSSSEVETKTSRIRLSGRPGGYWTRPHLV